MCTLYSQTIRSAYTSMYVHRESANSQANGATVSTGGQGQRFAGILTHSLCLQLPVSFKGFPSKSFLKCSFFKKS